MIDRQARTRLRNAAPAALLSAAALIAAGSILTGCNAGRTVTAQKQAATQAASDAADQATAHVRLGDAEAALMEFERAIELNPLMTRAYVGAGDQYMTLGDPVTAEVRFTEAARLDPENPRVHFKRGQALQVLGRIGEAIRAYLTSLELDPTDGLANMNVSVAYMQAEEPRLARPLPSERCSSNRTTQPLASIWARSTPR